MKVVGLLFAAWFYIKEFFSQKPLNTYSNLVETNTNDENDADRQLIVLMAVDEASSYYEEEVDKIINFHEKYVEIIKGKDNVVILVNENTYPKLKGKVPEDTILNSQFSDIWMRDFSTQVPKTMVEFKYDRDGTEDSDVQPKFDMFLDRYKLNRKKSTLKVDGGNIVDNNKDKAILSDKVYWRNVEKYQDEVISELKSALEVKEISIIPRDEEELGHADGQVCFVDDNVVLMNDYKDFTARQKLDLIDSIHSGLTDITIGVVKANFDNKMHGEFASACGIYVNAVVTKKFIYMPTFDNSAYDDHNYEVFKNYTTKTVVKVDSSGVCHMGGNCRCLTWQVTGENAKILIEEARKAYSAGSIQFLSFFVVFLFFMI